MHALCVKRDAYKGYKNFPVTHQKMACQWYQRGPKNAAQVFVNISPWLAIVQEMSKTDGSTFSYSLLHCRHSVSSAFAFKQRFGTFCGCVGLQCPTLALLVISLPLPRLCLFIQLLREAGKQRGVGLGGRSHVEGFSGRLNQEKRKGFERRLSAPNTPVGLGLRKETCEIKR